MSCAHDEGLITIIFVIGSVVFVCTFTLIILRVLMISALGEVESAKKLIPKNILLLADLFAFKAALFVLDHPRIGSKVRFMGIANALIYVIDIFASILLIINLLRSCT